MVHRRRARPSPKECGADAPAVEQAPVLATLAQLLRDAGLGDRQAFSRLYDETCHSLFDLVLRVVRDPSLAEDVVRATYVEVWTHSGRFQETTQSPLSWIMGLGYSRALASRSPI